MFQVPQNFNHIGNLHRLDKRYYEFLDTIMACSVDSELMI